MMHVTGSILAFVMIFLTPTVSLASDPDPFDSFPISIAPDEIYIAADLFSDLPIDIAPDKIWEIYVADAGDTIDEIANYRLYDGGRDEQSLQVQEQLPAAEKNVSRRWLERQYLKEMEREPIGGLNSQQQSSL